MFNYLCGRSALYCLRTLNYMIYSWCFTTKVAVSYCALGYLLSDFVYRISNPQNRGLFGGRVCEKFGKIGTFSIGQLQLYISS